MGRIRVVAAILAVLTAVVAGLFTLVPGVGMSVIGCCGIAVLCLAVIVPFEASEPFARKRVAAACLAFVTAIGVALLFAVQDGVDLGPAGALAGLATCGLTLSIWAFAVRNRRRRAAWADYYDR